ncbi:hypothetical protein [Salinicola tamaricis]|uniref:hypothetical protein n=1 Tax=Salinicola tamaricis TaxID=1771309 RepID=UPI001A91334A|nr:hypothetical protein [Salinicola tamaricis]
MTALTSRHTTRAGAPARHPGLNLGHAHREGEESREEMVFGFWVFMMSDMILFGLRFGTYGPCSAAPLAALGRKSCSTCGAPSSRPCCCW